MAVKVIRKFRLLFDVDWGAPLDGYIPIYNAGLDKLVMTSIATGGGFSLGLSNVGNTAGDTGVTGSRIVLAGVGAVSASQATDANGATISLSAPPQTVQTQNVHNVTLDGNTAGVLAEVSSGTMTLAGGDHITLSQNGNAITISGAGASAGVGGLVASDATYTSGTVSLLGSGDITVESGPGQQIIIHGSQSVQPETQTFVGGVANSQTTYTSGTIKLSELGAVTVRSTTGQQLQISVAPQSVQAETQTFVGGVAGSNATYTSGTVNIVGSGMVTVQSGTGQRLIINATQSVQPETQTFVGGLAASDTTYTSGTVRISGVGGGITVSSNTGQRIDLSVAAPVAQTGTQFSAGISGGNTAGDTGTVAGRLVLAGGTNITLSGSTNGASETVTILAGDVAFSGGVSNLGNTIGSTGVTGTRLVLAGGQSVTLSQSTDANGGTITISGASTSQSVQTQDRFDATISGNTSGAGQLVSSGTLTLAGGNNITLSQAGNAITISGANVGGAQTGISGIANSQTTYTSGTVSLSELGAITIRSTTGNQFQLSVAAQTAESQSIGMSNLGNTSGTTGIASGAQVRFLLAGGNNVTLSQSLNGASGTITISAAAQTAESQSIGMSNVGNTSGTTGVASGAQVRFVLAGGNNITLSQSLNGASGTVTISGPNTAAQTNQTLGMYAVQNTTGQSSSTTMDARTLSIAGDGIVSVGYSAGSLRISATEVPQTNQTEGWYALGNTTGQSSSTTRDARSLSVEGAGIVSVGYSGGSLRISASQSVQAETQTFVGGLANSETTYTSGTVKLSELGAITIRSTTGNQFQLSVNAQTVQTQNLHNVTLSGNTAGVMAQVSSGTMTLAGGNNITLSQNGNAITISGANVGGAQTGISGIIGSDATYTSGTVQFTGSNMVTVKSSAGQRVVIDATQSVQPGIQNLVASDATFSSGTVSISGFGDITVNTAANLIRISGPVQTVESQSIGMSNLGNTSGTTGIASGAQVRFLLAGGNNITLSQSINGASGTITISGGAGGAFSGGVSDVGNTVGDTGITGSRLVFAGGQSITLSQSTNASGGTITISGASTSQSVQSLGMYALGNTTGQSSSTTRDARSLSVEGAGIVSVGYSGGSLRISATQSVQPETQTFIGGIANSETTYTSGTVKLSELGAITVRSTTGNQFQLSVAAQTAESQSIGISNLGNTSGTTGIASGAQVRMLFAGGNNVTLSQSLNGASGTITISAFNQSNQSLGMYAVQNTTGQSSSTTMDARTLSVAGDGAVSVGYSAGSLRISAPTQTVESQSIGMSNVGNTSGTTGVASGGQVRFVFAGGNNITLSQSLNGASGTITISAPNLGAGAMSVGVSNLGNSAGATGITGTQLVLVGSNNITLSQTTGANGGTVSIIGGAGGGFSAGVSTGGNTAGDTGVTGTRLVLVGDSPISLSQATDANGGTVSIDAPATSSLVGTNGVSISTNGSTISAMLETRTFFAPYDEAPMVTGQQGQQSVHVMPMYIPNLQFDRILLGVQISNATNSSNSITLTHYIGIYTRNASTLSLLSSTSGSTNFSGSGTVGSYSLYGGPRQMSIPWTMTLTGSDYFIGINLRTTTGGGAGHSISQLLQSKFTNSDFSGLLGAAVTVSAQRLLGQGHWSVTTAGMPGTMAFSDIRGTGSIVLRAPVWHLRSGTV